MTTTARLTPAALLLAAAITAGCSTSTRENEVALNNENTTAQAAGFGDPFALSSAGFAFSGGNNPFATSNNNPAAPSTDSTSFKLYREAFAHAQNANNKPGAGTGNLAQVSFSQEGSDFDPDVSRDGTQIVFASTQHRNTPDIYIKSVDGRVVTQLTSDPASDVMPRVSPDGQRIAFASDRSGNWDIYVMPIAGGKAVQVTSSPSPDLHASWSPDGTQLVFSRFGEVSGQWEMWVADVANSGLARCIGFGLFPEWCPTRGTGTSGADRIAFQKSRERGDRAFAIWTIDFKAGQSGNATEIASSPVAACINPAWSHDGNWIAYATVPMPGQWNESSMRPSVANLWMVDVAGTSRISLTSETAVDLMPTWGPSNKLFFVSDRAGVDNIWCMDTTPVLNLAAMNASPSTAFASTPAHTSTTPTQPHATPHAEVVNVPEATTADPH